MLSAFQAQAAMYEQRLNEHAVELNANALAKEAAGRKREELEASHAEQFQVWGREASIYPRFRGGNPDFRVSFSLWPSIVVSQNYPPPSIIQLYFVFPDTRHNQ